MFGLLKALGLKEQQARAAQGQTLPPVPALPPMAGDPMPTDEAAGNEIVVEDDPITSRYKRGLVTKGPFSMGRTGGNILGLLGDAMLVQSGNQKQYEPRLQQARASEAMAGYTDDPMDAIQRLNEVDPPAAAALMDKLRAHQLDTDKLGVEAIGANDEFEGTTHERAQALIGAATESTYPAMRERYYNYYASRGIDPMYELPVEFDEDAIRSLATAGIPVGDQRELEEKARYNTGILEQNAKNEFGRNWREAYGEIKADKRSNRSEAGRETRNVRDNRTRRDTAKGGSARPTIKFGTRKDGTRYVIR